MTGSEEAAEADPETAPILINVTAAADAAPGGVLALAAMPRAGDFWRGALFAAPGDGGLVAYDADGNAILTEDGPRYSALATAPDFQMRGADLPLLAAVDAAAGGVSIYAFSRDQAAVFLAPTDPIAPDAVARGVCAASDEASSFTILILGEAGGAELWRLEDTGDQRLAASRVLAFDTPDVARLCTVDTETGDMYVSGPGTGVVRISSQGEVLAEVETSADGLAFGLFAGRRRVVATQSGGEVLMLDPETLETAETARITQGFSTPGVDTPGAVTYTARTYGGAYPDGFLAIGDSLDGRPKFIDRTYIGKRLVEPVNPFAPGPASAA